MGHKVVHEDTNFVLPSGSPGEMIIIPPPRFVIMEVHHIGEDMKTLILPCEKQKTELDYHRNSKECCYRCLSKTVVLSLALTVHETQGQTLRRILLLLGRLSGMNVGLITWSLIYGGLSREKNLAHIKFFPTGLIKYYHSMYFAHLLKLCLPENLQKWYRSDVDQRWDRYTLRNEHLLKVRKAEKKLERLGEDTTKRLRWILLS